MNRALRQIAICALILFAFCIGCRLFWLRDYTAYIRLGAGPAAQQAGDYRLELSDPQVMSHRGPEVRDGVMQVVLHPQKRGMSDVKLFDASGAPVYMTSMYVGPFDTVYDSVTGGFTADIAVLIAVTAFWLAVSGIMIWNYHQAKGPAFYAYTTIYYAGFSMFALATGLFLLDITIRHLRDPAEYSMHAAYRIINSASIQFMMLTMPLLVIFALAMIISNIVLLRHMTPRFRNVLGILIGVVLIAGEAVGMFLYQQNVSGSEMQVRIRDTLVNVYATVFVYFECMLAGAVICGYKATRFRPAPDKDFIVILGCWFRKDGTLPPLLQGRVEKAIEFWRWQRASTGKEAVMIPSGGQGPNESMPEAEAIRRYLVLREIPEELIRVEDQSHNTYENMANSKRIIEAERPDARTVFATTQYHIFRSGLWGNLAGLHAEGVGAKTKWWFWPNAFMRECVGLLQNRWKQELVFLAVLIIFFALLSIVLG